MKSESINSVRFQKTKCQRKIQKSELSLRYNAKTNREKCNLKHMLLSCEVEGILEETRGLCFVDEEIIVHTDGKHLQCSCRSQYRHNKLQTRFDFFSPWCLNLSMYLSVIHFAFCYAMCAKFKDNLKLHHDPPLS